MTPRRACREPLHALVGGNPQQAPFELGLGTREPGAPHERRGTGWDAEPFNFDPRYFHELPLSLWADVDHCSQPTILRCSWSSPQTAGAPEVATGLRRPRLAMSITCTERIA